MYVDDVCSAINLVINKGELNTIINIGSGEPHTIGEIMEYCKRKMQSSSEFIPVNPPDFHNVVQKSKHMCLDNTILKALGFKQRVGLWSGLEKIMESVK